MNELAHDLYIQLCEVREKEYDKKFSKNKYEKIFKDFTNRHQEFYQKLASDYEQSEKKENYIKQLAFDFYELVKNELDTDTKKRKQQEKIFEINFKLVTFVFPGCSVYADKAGTELCDAISKCWKENFPKTPVMPASYEQIKDGFHHNFCYITTAVCKSLDKGDSCYELNCLRDFRDNYILQTEHGEAFVKEYYDLAPTIVKHIERLEGKEEVYRKIFQNYIQPCIGFIEQNENKKCMEFYEQMVYDLKEEYFFS